MSSKPKLVLSFVPNAYTDNERPVETVACRQLVPSDRSDGNWTLGKPQPVTFPTGETVTAMAEITPYGNYVHINHQGRRLLSLKTTGSVNAMFLLPCGEEAYAALSDGMNELVG